MFAAGAHQDDDEADGAEPSESDDFEDAGDHRMPSLVARLRVAVYRVQPYATTQPQCDTGSEASHRKCHQGPVRRVTTGDGGRLRMVLQGS